jgi:hypothetical protein
MIILRWFARLFVRDDAQYIADTAERRYMTIQSERSR